MFSISKSSFSPTDDLLRKCQKSLENFLSRKDIGFSQIPFRDALWHSSEKIAQNLRGKFTDLVVVGIGGSALGPRVLVELFTSPQAAHRVHFCDNIDPMEFNRLLSTLPTLEKTCWAVVSKSGSTIETLTSTDFIRQTYETRGLNFYQNVVVISEPKSNPLVEWAKAHDIPQLEIPLDVGGRFSVLTPVGMLPAAFLGIPIGEIRRGAESALKMHSLVADIMAQSLMSFDRQEWITFFWFYSSGLKSFGGWLQQLWAESLGKAKARNSIAAARVSTPFSAVGACDQHSVLQQVMEGAKDKFVVFIRVDSLEKAAETLSSTEFPIQKFLVGKKMGELLAAEAKATQEALMQQSISTIALRLKDQSPASIGALFMFWQLVVAGLGEYLDIDAFDQPGVELGKKLAKESLNSPMGR